MTLNVRLSVKQYIHQNLYQAQIQFVVEDNQCQHLIDRLVDSFMAANPRLAPRIEEEVNEGPSSRLRQQKNTWKDRLRKACAAYCRALYIEFDLADLYLKPDGQAPHISCIEATTHADCFSLACSHARIICKESKKINGFNFFEAA